MVYRPRNSPYWHFDFQRGGYRFTGSTQERTKSEAAKIEKAEIAAAERLVVEVRKSGRRPLTIGQACERWWQEVGQHLNETDLAPRLQWLRDRIGDRQLHLLSDDDIAQLVTARRAEVKRSGADDAGKPLFKPISPRTVNRTVPMLLRRVVRRAHKNWNAVIFREPNWSAHFLPEEARSIRELSFAQESAIAETESPDQRAVRSFATIMGLRLREVLLRWPQIDFDRGTIRVKGKGGKWAELPLPRDAYAILWAERGRNPEWVFTYIAAKTWREPRTGRDYIKGERYPLTYSGISSHRVRRWRAAGVDARFHDLRHTAAMRTLRATGNLKAVQRLLRHESVTTTADFYADAMLEDVRDALETTARDVSDRKKSRTKATKAQ